MNMGTSIKVNKTGIVALVTISAIIILVYRNNYSSTNTPTKAIDSNGDELISLKELLSAAVDAAKRGGDEVRRIREEATLNMQSKGETAEGVNDPVTDGDMKSHLVMYYSITKAFPLLEVISEEHDTSTADTSGVAPANIRDPEIESAVISDSIILMKDVQVWIDPLDATKEYTEDLRQYVTTMVGISVNGQPVIGVVHRPFSNETHWAWIGQGTSQDLKALTSVPGSPPPDPRIIVSISHQGTVKEVATQAFGAGATIIPAAGAGYKILEVIRGNADAYVHNTAIKKWDLLAGDAIIRAMGGQLTSLDNDKLNYSDRSIYKVENGLLATMQHHQYYLEKLSTLRTAH